MNGYITTSCDFLTVLLNFQVHISWNEDKKNLNRKGVGTHKQMYIDMCNCNFLGLNGETLAFYS